MRASRGMSGPLVATALIFAFGLGLMGWAVYSASRDTEGDFLLLSRGNRVCWRVSAYHEYNDRLKFKDSLGAPVVLNNYTIIAIKKPHHFEIYRKRLKLPKCL